MKNPTTPTNTDQVTYTVRQPGCTAWSTHTGLGAAARARRQLRMARDAGLDVRLYRTGRGDSQPREVPSVPNA